MSNISRELEEMKREAEAAKAEATQKRIDAEKAIDDAVADEDAAARRLDAINEAQEKILRANELHAEAMRDIYGDYEEQEYPERKKADNGNKRLITGLVIGALAGALVTYVLVKESKTGKVVNTRANDDVHTISNDVLPVVSEAPVSTDKPALEYDSKTNTAVVLVPEYEELTTDEFESLVADYAKIYASNNVSVSTSDITKFASIVNIDKLAEDNPELISELAKNQTKEEYLNDAAKVIGATVMKNFTIWNTTNSTEGFIKVSDVVFGEQKDNALKVEEYTDRIAAAVNKQDGELVNSLVSELITELNSGSLSKLDDGVGFGLQVNIAVIADGIARNYLNQENFNKFQILKTSEKYVSNIFTVYERCMNQSNGKVLTLN